MPSVKVFAPLDFASVIVSIADARAAVCGDTCDGLHDALMITPSTDQTSGE